MENQIKSVEATAQAAPAVLGVAAGMVLSDLMNPSARRPVAFSLLCAGVALASPKLVEKITAKLKGPGTEKGDAQTLEGIRQSNAESSFEDPTLDEPISMA